jgi:TadE-like protein
MRRNLRRGATTIEMTLVGIPIIFILISVFEISRGMWMYNTAAHAVREGLRFAVVHGVDCVNNPPGVINDCAKTAAQVAAVIRFDGVGLDPANTRLTFRAPSGTGGFQCTLAGTQIGGGTSCSAVWPPNPFNARGTPLEIVITTPFNSALAMFWPGTRPASFATVNLWANSIDTVQF